LAYTLFVGEKLTNVRTDLGWLSGTPATLRNGGSPLNAEIEKLPDDIGPPPWQIESDEAVAEGEVMLPHSKLGGDPENPLNVGGFGSYHPLGANVAYGDGSVEFLSDNISQEVLAQLAHRQDGELVERGQ
jgi:prepilin-type processing-associated H-X9-DG protein